MPVIQVQLGAKLVCYQLNIEDIIEINMHKKGWIIGIIIAFLAVISASCARTAVRSQRFFGQ
jgi:hypothetical protein